MSLGHHLSSACKGLVHDRSSVNTVEGRSERRLTHEYLFVGASVVMKIHSYCLVNDFQSGTLASDGVCLSGELNNVVSHGDLGLAVMWTTEGHTRSQNIIF